MSSQGLAELAKAQLPHLFATIQGFWISVSATTRAPRVGEKDGVDYFFYSEEKIPEFDRFW
ncbi:MAG: hypothetical protein WDN07_03610 [Actinomycetota bacterium]